MDAASSCPPAPPSGARDMQTPSTQPKRAHCTSAESIVAEALTPSKALFTPAARPALANHPGDHHGGDHPARSQLRAPWINVSPGAHTNPVGEVDVTVAHGPFSPSAPPTVVTKPVPGRRHELSDSRVLQREKQISFGFNTEGYRNMLRLVEHDPRLRRGGVLPLQPPAVDLRTSKRNWDVMIRKWRRALHMFDDVFIDGEDERSGKSQADVIAAQKLKWRSAAYEHVNEAAVTTVEPHSALRRGAHPVGRVRVTREEFLQRRDSPLVPAKIPVEEAVCVILRNMSCYEPISNVVPESASSLTKGSSWVSPAEAGIKILVAPSMAVPPTPLRTVGSPCASPSPRAPPPNSSGGSGHQRSVPAYRPPSGSHGPLASSPAAVGGDVRSVTPGSQWRSTSPHRLPADSVDRPLEALEAERQQLSYTGNEWRGTMLTSRGDTPNEGERCRLALGSPACSADRLTNSRLPMSASAALSPAAVPWKSTRLPRQQQQPRLPPQTHAALGSPLVTVGPLRQRPALGPHASQPRQQSQSLQSGSGSWTRRSAELTRDTPAAPVTPSVKVCPTPAGHSSPYREVAQRLFAVPPTPTQSRNVYADACGGVHPTVVVGCVPPAPPDPVVSTPGSRYVPPSQRQPHDCSSP